MILILLDTKNINIFKTNYFAVDTKSVSSPSSFSSCSSVRASPVDCNPIITHLPCFIASLNIKIKNDYLHKSNHVDKLPSHINCVFNFSCNAQIFKKSLMGRPKLTPHSFSHATLCIN